MPFFFFFFKVISIFKDKNYVVKDKMHKISLQLKIKIKWPSIALFETAGDYLLEKLEVR